MMLAARNEEALQQAAREIEEAGGTASYRPTDVSQWDQVERLAAETVREFGRIDTWINNAGIALYADISQASADEMRRVVEVNLLGEMYGTKAAFEQMKSAGRGVIINVSSALARRSVPLQAAYCGAKHGVSGFTEAVRMELQRSYPNIKLVEVLPSSINTPLFDHARSKLGEKPMPIPPIYEPSVVARALVEASEQAPREVVVGGAGKLFVATQQLNARIVDTYLLQNDRGFRQQRSGRPDDGVDNLSQPMPGPGSTTGSWSEDSRRSSLYTEFFEFHPWRKAFTAFALSTTALLALRRAGR